MRGRGNVQEPRSIMCVPHEFETMGKQGSRPAPAAQGFREGRRPLLRKEYDQTGPRRAISGSPRGGDSPPPSGVFQYFLCLLPPMKITWSSEIFLLFGLGGRGKEVVAFTRMSCSAGRHDQITSDSGYVQKVSVADGHTESNTPDLF